MNKNHKNQASLEELLNQKEIFIHDLIQKIKSIESEKLFYKSELEKLQNQNNNKQTSSKTARSNEQKMPYITAYQRSNDTFERFFYEFETYLNDSKSINDLSIENLCENTVVKLIDHLIKINSNSTNSKRANLDTIKKTISTKLSQISHKLQSIKQIEIKNVQLECKIEQLKNELEALKASIDFKRYFLNNKNSPSNSVNQQDLLINDSIYNELLNWKFEMMQLNKKILEQNQIIRLLVEKCDYLKLSNNKATSTSLNNSSSSESTRVRFNQDASNNNITTDETSTATAIARNDDQSSSPTSSLPYETLDQSDYDHTFYEETIEYVHRLPANNNNDNANTVTTTPNTSTPTPQNAINTNTANGPARPLPPITTHRTAISSTGSSNTNSSHNRSNENEILLQIYQCPKCFIEITNEIDFNVFKEHCDNCDSNKLVCMFCLRLFDKENMHQYVLHVQSHE